MRKVDFPLIADTVLYGASAAFLALAILRYFRMGFALAVPGAVLIGLAVSGIVFLIVYGRHRKRMLTKRQTEKRDALMLHLALEKDERVRAALLAALCADGKEAHCEEDELSADGERYVPLFTMQPVSADEIARQIRRHGQTRFTAVCNKLSPEAEKLLASFGMKALCADDVFALFERTDTTPDPLICGDLPRRTGRKKLRAAFLKRNARPFFVSGFFLLLMSLFALFPVYYIVTGSALILCAIFVRAFGYSEL